ncbi:hypothetical protein T4A_5878 [Trichinella pseudospiralis]|uniref:Uncharacterized protein n=1 Tax=Trichinella pseudospiralis TaxID=6337 RepID=A0A0V1EIZ7_TRIPS|nr:hypothetical protein T4A_5878 [Trichinella pseudospiralis]
MYTVLNSWKGVIAYFLAFFIIAKNIDEFDCALKFTLSKMTKQVKFPKKPVENAFHFAIFVLMYLNPEKNRDTVVDLK